MIELIIENKEFFILNAIVLTLLNLIIIKTWFENHFYCIRENKKPEPNKFLNMLGEISIFLWFVDIIILISI